MRPNIYGDGMTAQEHEEDFQSLSRWERRYWGLIAIVSFGGPAVMIVLGMAGIVK